MFSNKSDAFAVFLLTWIHLFIQAFCRGGVQPRHMELIFYTYSQTKTGGDSIEYKRNIICL